MNLSQTVKYRDGFRCQLCGDWKEKLYSETDVVVSDIHAHHIIPRFQGGLDTMENLITLCDFCHAVVTPQWWAWFGISQIQGGKDQMHQFKKVYDEYLTGKKFTHPQTSDIPF
ncbi:HNH endonuclease [Candidatus Amesbacteria bacterium]|nr:HNH endonuclease [Candidatus Amesbacteria bacterium]